MKLYDLRYSSVMLYKSSIELAELIVPGLGGTDPPLSIRPDEELIIESPDDPIHCGDGTFKYLLIKYSKFDNIMYKIIDFFSLPCYLLFTSCSSHTRLF